MTAGTPYVGSNRIPLAAGLRARATSAFDTRMSSSVASIPTAANIRRSVFRWSIAMIAKTPSSPRCRRGS
jgi:hypothetical protein